MSDIVPSSVVGPSPVAGPPPAVGPPPVLVGLMGTVTILGQPVPATLDRLVLARLVLAEGRSVPVSTLIEALWSGELPERARNALQVKISRLRSRLGEHRRRLEYRHGGYRLAITALESDVGRFTWLVRAATQAVAAGEADAITATSAALDAWLGELPDDLSRDPAVHAERVRLRELWLATREAHAEALSGRSGGLPDAIALLRQLLAEEPLRPRGRLLLMRALHASGRRAEALAVYDAGRRLFRDVGLEPPTELQAEFERILAEERAAIRRPPVRHIPAQAPDGLMEVARWAADQGDVHAGLRLAVRGCWWWWIGGHRGPARELLEDLLTIAADQPGVDDVASLSAEAWLGVFGSVTVEVAEHMRRAEAALAAAGPEWTKPQAVAATLIAERLYERGDHGRARALARLAMQRFTALDDAWGQSLVATVVARGRLLSGDVTGAELRARRRLNEFANLDDPAGLVLALDILGYCAEVQGHLDRALQIHTRALEVARHIGSPDWEVAQTIRIGNVRSLAGEADAVKSLTAALRLSADIGSHTLHAFALNGLGVSLDLMGDRSAALERHRQAWAFYEQTDSVSGMAYTGARIALVASDGDAVSLDGDALGRASAALRDAAATNDPRAIAHSLEALAMVQPEPTAALRALAAAHGLRQSSNAPLPPRQARRLQHRRAELAARLGGRFDRLWHEAHCQPRRVADELHASASVDGSPDRA